MAISTYTELKTALQNWSGRTDTNVTNRLDEFIALAEDRLFYGDESIGLQPLRVSGMESSESLTISSQETALPTGFLEARALYLDSNPKEPLPYFPPDRFWESAAADSGSGKPTMYTIQGTNLVVAPAPDSSYTGKLICYKKFTGLSGSNSTNWLITNSPGTYLAATMLELSEFTEDDANIAKYSRQTAGRVKALNDQDKRARHSGSILSVKPDRVAPSMRSRNRQ